MFNDSDSILISNSGNLKPAEKLGISTIKVNDVNSALVELQNLVDVDLDMTPGTSRIRKGMEIDQEKLLGYMVNELKMPGNKMTVRQFQHGQSNPTYLLKMADRQAHLRNLLLSFHEQDSRGKKLR